MEFQISEKDFKEFSKNLKKHLNELNIKFSLGASQNLLARTFGYKDYNTILPVIRIIVNNENKSIENKTNEDIDITNIFNESGVYFTLEQLDIIRKFVKCEDKEYALSVEESNSFLMELLKPNQLKVLLHRIILREKFKPIAESMNLSVTRIRQIENDVIKKLIHPKIKKILFVF